MVVVALVVFLAAAAARALGARAAGGLVYVTYIFWETPQLSYNTMGARVPHAGRGAGRLGRGARWRAALGASARASRSGWPWSRIRRCSSSCRSTAVFLAFALGRRSVGMVAQSASRAPARARCAGPPTGGPRGARSAAWVARRRDASCVPVGLYCCSASASRNLERSLGYTMAVAQSLDQLGGRAKAYEVAAGLLAVLWSAAVSRSWPPRRLPRVPALAAGGAGAAGVAARWRCGSPVSARCSTRRAS